MLQKLRRVLKSKKGQGMVEYGILVGGVALVTLAAVATLGHKTNDLLATVASALPGAHTDDNAPIISGKLVATTSGAAEDDKTGLVLDVSSPGSMSGNLGFNASTLVVEPGS